MTPLEQGVREEIDKRMPQIVVDVAAGVLRALRRKDIEKRAEQATEAYLDKLLMDEIERAIIECVEENREQIGSATREAVRALFRAWMSERKI